MTQISRVLILAYYLCNLYGVQGTPSVGPGYLSNNLVSCNDPDNPGFVVYDGTVVVAASHDIVQTYRTFVPSGKRIISCVLAVDELNNGATARITAGGVNNTNVTIYFTSVMGKGIYFTVEIFTFT